MQLHRKAIEFLGTTALPLGTAWGLYALGSALLGGAGPAFGVAAVFLGLVFYGSARCAKTRFYDRQALYQDLAPVAIARQLLARLVVYHGVVVVGCVVGFFVATWWMYSHPELFAETIAKAAHGDPSLNPSALRRQLVLLSGVGAMTLAGIISACFIYGVLFWSGTSSYRRGRRLLTFEEAKRFLAYMLKQLGQAGEIAFGALKLPCDAATKHFAFIGSTGSGKTNLILVFLQSMLTAKQTHKRSLIYDPKRDLYGWLSGIGLGDRLRLLNPFDLRSSSWDLAADCASSDLAQELASIFIPESKDAKSKFFVDAAQQIFAGCLMVLQRRLPGAWTLRDAILMCESKVRLEEGLALYPDTGSLLNEYFTPEDTLQNIRATLANSLRKLRPVAAAWDRAVSKVSLREFMSGSLVLVVSQHDSHRMAMDALTHGLFSLASQLILAGPDVPEWQTLFAVDEVRDLLDKENPKWLARLLTMSRSKGTCMALGFQCSAGLKAAVGEHGASELVDNIWNLCIGHVNDEASSEWASRLVGDVELEAQNVSAGPGGSTVSRYLTNRRVLMPAFFQQLPPASPQTGVQGVFISPYTGIFTTTVPAKEIARVRANRRKDVVDFVPRPASHLELRPFDEADAQRLGFGFAARPKLRVVKTGTDG